ncbi:hypothetical protein BKA80DRAFT_299371 [Phyllosticta citrichinensis]
MHSKSASCSEAHANVAAAAMNLALGGEFSYTTLPPNGHVRHDQDHDDSKPKNPSVKSHFQQSKGLHAQHTVNEQTKLDQTSEPSGNSAIKLEQKSSTDLKNNSSIDKEKKSAVDKGDGLFNGKEKDMTSVNDSKQTNLKEESLWDQAYQELKKSQNGPVAKFKKIVSDESCEKDGPSSEPEDIKSQLDRVIKRKLKELSDLNWQNGLPEGVPKVIKAAQALSKIVGKAVEKSPEASLAWSAITLCLPLMIALGESAESFRTGLVYITARMEYFAALGRRFSELKMSQPDMLKDGRLELYILELYSGVLEYQLLSVSRLYRNRASNAVRDMTTWDDWGDKLSSIQKKEASVDEEADRIGWNQSREHLSKINEQLDDYFHQLLDIERQNLEVSKKIQNATSNHLQLALTQVERDCISTFAQVEYMKYKSTVPSQVPGTCEWFTNDPLFQEWLNKKSRFLIISAGPGCGKSVLTKYLIESLMDHAMCPFNREAENLAEHTSSLWNIIETATFDEGSGDVIFVLDALDECGGESRDDLLNKLRQHFQSPQNTSRLRFLCTSRPRRDIISKFNFEDSLHIKYDESDKIGEDVKLVIKERVKGLNWKGELSSHLESRLLEVQNRTYLWIHLIFDFLDPPSGRTTELVKETTRGIDKLFETLPKTVFDAYEKLLSRSTEPQKLRKALCIILAAERPFTISEMNVAMESEEMTASLDCESDENFEKRLQDWSGLFISIIGKKVYLLHQTAREFLLREEGQQRDLQKWQCSISLKETRLVLAKAFTGYIISLAGPGEIHTSEGTSPFQDYIFENFQRYFVLSAMRMLIKKKVSKETTEMISTYEDLFSRVFNKNPSWGRTGMMMKTGISLPPSSVPDTMYI